MNAYDYDKERVYPTNEVLADPLHHYIPKDVGVRYTMALELVKAATVENFDRIAAFITRPEFSNEYALLVIMEATRKCTRICETEGFIKWAKGDNGITPLKPF